MEIESGKILLEKSIQHLDDITSLITFIKEKMDSWRRLKVILIGKKKEVFKSGINLSSISSDVEEDCKYNVELTKYYPYPETEQIPEVKMEIRSDPDDTGSDEDIREDNFMPERWNKILKEDCKREEKDNCSVLGESESELANKSIETLKIKSNQRTKRGKYKGSRKGCPNKMKKVDKIDVNGTFVCHECGDSFEGHLLYRKHVKIKHASNKEREYQCPLCGEMMTCKYSKFQTHKWKCEASVAVDANFICSICGKAYPTQKKLSMHMYICQLKCSGQPAKRQPKLECSYDGCGYKIDGRTNLENHIRKVHLNIPISKNFVCNICGSTYNKKGHLKMHISSIHENLKPFKCEHCGRDFARRQRLKEHVEGIHQGLLKHKCNYCDKAYNNNGSKWNHMKSCNFNPNKL